MPVTLASDGKIRDKRAQKFKIIFGYIMGLKAGLEYLRPCQKKRRAGERRMGREKEKEKTAGSHSPDIENALSSCDSHMGTVCHHPSLGVPAPRQDREQNSGNLQLAFLTALSSAACVCTVLRLHLADRSPSALSTCSVLAPS